MVVKSEKKIHLVPAVEGLKRFKEKIRSETPMCRKMCKEFQLEMTKNMN